MTISDEIKIYNELDDLTNPFSSPRDTFEIANCQIEKLENKKKFCLKDIAGNAVKFACENEVKY